MCFPLNNLQFKDYLHQIYPSELEIKETTDTPALASYLDLYLYIDNYGRLTSNLYDKHDDFDFPIVNFPFLSSIIPTSPAYGVYISQLIRYCRVTFSTERNYRLKNYYARIRFSHCWYRHSRSFTVYVVYWCCIYMLSDKFRYIKWYTCIPMVEKHDNRTNFSI